MEHLSRHRRFIGITVAVGAVLLGVTLAPNHITRAFHMGDGFPEDFPLPGLGRNYDPEYYEYEHIADTQSSMDIADSRKLCNKLRRYCQSQIRSNEAAQKALGKSGIVHVLPEPPVCASERSVCGSFYDEDDCFCPRVYQPVCATNGRTYENECLAHCRNKTVDHQGTCGITGHQVSSRSHFPGYPPHTYPPPNQNSSMAGCFCTQEYNPVCGVDGRTYPNACHAHCANIRVAYSGMCGASSSRSSSHSQYSSSPQQFCNPTGTCYRGTACPSGSYCVGHPTYRCYSHQCTLY